MVQINGTLQTTRSEFIYNGMTLRTVQDLPTFRMYAYSFRIEDALSVTANNTWAFSGYHLSVVSMANTHVKFDFARVTRVETTASQQARAAAQRQRDEAAERNRALAQRRAQMQRLSFADDEEADLPEIPADEPLPAIPAQVSENRLVVPNETASLSFYFRVDRGRDSARRDPESVRENIGTWLAGQEYDSFKAYSRWVNDAFYDNATGPI